MYKEVAKKFDMQERTISNELMKLLRSSNKGDRFSTQYEPQESVPKVQNQSLFSSKVNQE